MTAATLFTILIVVFALSFLLFVFVAQRIVSRRRWADNGSSSVAGGDGGGSGSFGDSRSDCGFDSGSGDCGGGDGGGGGGGGD